MRRARTVEYAVAEDGCLRRTVRRPGGGAYVHHCQPEVYEQVAHAFEDGQGHTLTELAQSLDLPYTQIDVALEFMKARGCVVVGRGRRSYAASEYVLEDAQVEYHALREKSGS